MINEMYVDSTKEFNGFDTLDLAIIRKYISPCLNAMASIRETIYNNKFSKNEIVVTDRNIRVSKWEHIFTQLDVLESSLFAYRLTDDIKVLSKKILRGIRKLKIHLLFFKLPIFNYFMFNYTKNYLFNFYNKIFVYLKRKDSTDEIYSKINQGCEDCNRFFEGIEDKL